MDKGAHFYNCDFQVHTPRDNQWHGLEAVTEEERKQYAKEFVNECRNKGINAVAITDHHDLVFYKYIKEAAENEIDENGNYYSKDQQLIVFPGMELTLSTPPCQAILILDPSLTEDDFNNVLAKLSIEKVDASISKLGAVVRINDTAISNLNDICKKLDDLSSLKNKYILLPNVSSRGSDTILRQGYQEIYKGMKCIAGYVDGKKRDDDSWKNKINGGDPNYGNKSIAVIQTSDNRNRDFTELGTATSWIKWSVPTTEALRQAFLAKESRVTDEEPKLPKQWIESIDISDSKFFGSLHINFNQQYNAIIGGRGTGKSTILEYVRWSLYDEIMYDDENPIDKKRKAILETLTGNIKIVFYNSGVRYVLKKNKEGGKPLLKIGEAEFEETEVEFIKKIFPLQSYSQKQLSSVSNNTQEIDRLLNINENEKEAIDKQLEDIKDVIKNKYEEVIKYNNYIKDKNILISQKNSFLEQKKQLNSSLINITEEQKAIIDQKEKYINNSNKVNEIIEKFSQVTNKLSGVEKIEINKDYATEPEEISKFWDDNKTQIEITENRINEQIQAVSLLNEEIKKCLNDFSNNWKKEEEKYIKKYKEVDGENVKNKQILQKILNIDKEINKIDIAIKDLDQKIEDIANCKEEYNKAKEKWYELHNKNIELSQEECSKINDLSNGYIKAEVDNKLNEVKTIAILKKLFQGTRITEEKCKGIVFQINKQDSTIEKWIDMLEEISKIINSDKDTDVSTITTTILSAAGIAAKDKELIREKIENDQIVSLICKKIEFEKSLNYVVNRKDDEKIPFENASAGQQATALLYILLNQEGEPLLIDQPEDDIDSNAITEIIKLIWNCKKNRQIIFTSHNANMVVNGDAELILVCGYRDDGNYSLGHIKVEGAIDDIDVKKEITTIMEGGEKAFKLRQAKYGF